MQLQISLQGNEGLKCKENIISFFIQGEKQSSEKLNDLQNQWQKNQRLWIAAPYKMLGETKYTVSRLKSYEK